MLRLKSWLMVGMLCAALISCVELNSSAQSPLVGTEAGEGELAVTATLTPTMTPTPRPTITNTPTMTPTVVLAPDPIVIEFEAEDGQQLSGLYYPAADNPAPVMVLFHWARGDQQDWRVIASWIQDRQLSVEADPARPWLDPSWFPERSPQPSLGVFTFSFRECQEGCAAWLTVDWLKDVQAAMEAVTRVHGVDPQVILTMGASIGADGAVNGCEWINNTDLGRCRGALALSPASYLTVPFEETALALLQDNPRVNLVCAFARRDDAVWETCSALPESTQVDYGYVDDHGMEIFQPQRDPNILRVLDQFIQDSLR